MTAKRGTELREHILWVAKDVFLELGFERASMDVVANRAETSKRTLYAHFESKEKLFLAIVELVRGLFLAELKQPADYSKKPADALTSFCSRYLEVLFGRSVRMCRVALGEVDRFPEGAKQVFDVLFGEVQGRLTVYLRTTFSMSPNASAAAAEELLARILFPRLPRALFGADPAVESVKEGAIEIDPKPIRRAVADLLASIPKAAGAPSSR